MQIAGISAGAGLIGGVVAWNLLLVGTPRLPETDELWALNRKPAVQFVDANGETLAVRGNLYGPVVRGAELPAYVGHPPLRRSHGDLDNRAGGRSAGQRFALPEVTGWRA